MLFKNCKSQNTQDTILLVPHSVNSYRPDSQTVHTHIFYKKNKKVTMMKMLATIGSPSASSAHDNQNRSASTVGDNRHRSGRGPERNRERVPEGDNGKALCRDFMRGRCTRSNCKFLHNSDNTSITQSDTTEPIRKEPGTRPPRGSAFNSKDNKRTNRAGEKRRKNTESFEPMDRPADMRVMYHYARRTENDDGYPHAIMPRDVICLHGLFDDFVPGDIYNRISQELEDGDVETKLWHGDTHFIVDDRRDWKGKVPTYSMVIERLARYFDMDVQATRLNVYTDTSHWKPFHHDAAAIDPEKSKVQNFTLAVSFGSCRDAAFEHARTHVVVSFPQPDGCVYAFAKDANVEWKHGILKDTNTRNEGRISIILWGKVNQR